MVHFDRRNPLRGAGCPLQASAKENGRARGRGGGGTPPPNFHRFFFSLRTPRAGRSTAQPISSWGGARPPSSRAGRRPCAPRDDDLSRDPIADGYALVEARHGRRARDRLRAQPPGTRFSHYGLSGRNWRSASPPTEIAAYPQPSAFSLAAARLGWSLPETGLREPATGAKSFRAHGAGAPACARVLALSWDETTPARLARLLADRGMGGSEIKRCWRRWAAPRGAASGAQAPRKFAIGDIDPLNTVAIARSRPGPDAADRAAGGGGAPRRLVRDRRPAHQGRDPRRVTARRRSRPAGAGS